MNTKLDIHQFFDEILYLSDEKVFSNTYIDHYIDYFKEVNLFLYDSYEKDKITVSFAATILDNFIKAHFKHKPASENIIDDDYGNIQDY